MRTLFIQKRFDLLILMVAAWFPIYMYSISGVILPTFAVVSILLYFLSKKKIDNTFFLKKLHYFLITTGFYLLMVVSVLYTSNLERGLLILTHGIYILVYPFVIIFFVGDVSKKQLNQILVCFVIATAVYLVYMQYCFYIAGLYTNFRPAEFNDLPFREVLSKLKLGRAHPTYISMWFLFSALFIIHFLLENRVRVLKKIALMAWVAILVFSSVILSVKITILAFFFSLLLLVYLMLKNKWIVFLSFSLIAILFIFSLFKVSFLRARFIDEFKATELKPPIGIRTNSLNIRVGIFECTIEVFKTNWLIGTGVGDTQDELNKCYFAFDTNVYKEHNYDTHNNYLEVAVSTGSIGLFAFLFMLIFHVRESIRYKNTLFLIFLVFVMICMLPENILSRNHGVVFYTIFSSLFMKLNLENNLHEVVKE